MNDKQKFIAAAAAFALSMTANSVTPSYGGPGRSISYGGGIDRSKIRAKRKQQRQNKKRGRR